MVQLRKEDNTVHNELPTIRSGYSLSCSTVSSYPYVDV